MSLTQNKNSKNGDSKRAHFRSNFAFVLTGNQDSHLPNPPDKQSRFVSLTFRFNEKSYDIFENKANNKRDFF